MTEDTLIRNCMVVLQSCTNSLNGVAGLCSGRSATSSGDVPEAVSIMAEDVADMDIQIELISVIKVEGYTGLDVKEEEIPVVKFEEETAIDVKQEEIPEDITFPKIKAEEEEVSYMPVCPLLYAFHRYPIVCTTFVISTVSPCLSLWPYKTDML
jgi:hypothetical protein